MKVLFIEFHRRINQNYNIQNPKGKNLTQQAHPGFGKYSRSFSNCSKFI
jgi:hypothetical protein